MPRLPEAYLECLVCKVQLDLEPPQIYGCPSCSGQGRKAALVVRYKTSAEQLRDGSKPGIWRWRELLPPVPDDRIVSLHEGGTPLIRLRSGVYLKNETVNPTWSWKDRAACVSINMARMFGFKETVAISTGNLGNSVSAYSSAAGLGCTIFCNSDAPDLQLALMRHYGSRVFRGGNQNALVRQLVERGGVFPASIVCPLGGFANPFGVEGFKTIAFEIFDQLGGRVPDRVYVPVGSGDGFYGIWKGFCELHELGLTASRPKMMACQAEGANVFVRAFRERAAKLTKLASVHTVALSIAEEIGGHQSLGAIYESGGEALEVSDEKIMDAARLLAREGFAVEPASATSYACARQVAEQAPSDETWVAIGTGSLVKWPPVITRGFTMPKQMPADFADLDSLLAGE